MCGPEDVPRFLCFPPGPVFGQRPAPPSPDCPAPSSSSVSPALAPVSGSWPWMATFWCRSARERLTPYRKPPLGPKQHVRVSPGTDSGKGWVMTASQSKAGEGRGAGPAVAPGRAGSGCVRAVRLGKGVLAFRPLARHSALRGSGLFHTGPPPVLPWFSSAWHRPRGAGADPVGTGPAQDGPHSKCQPPLPPAFAVLPTELSLFARLADWHEGHSSDGRGTGAGYGGRWLLPCPLRAWRPPPNTSTRSAAWKLSEARA